MPHVMYQKLPVHGKSNRTLPDTKKPAKPYAMRVLYTIPDYLGLQYGGETGIRTLGGIAATIDFESIPFGHSGISPWRMILTQA
jgi:hypothetical protein